MKITVKQLQRIINGIPKAEDYKGIAIEVPIPRLGGHERLTFRKVMIDFDYEWMLEINKNKQINMMNEDLIKKGFVWYMITNTATSDVQLLNTLFSILKDSDVEIKYIERLINKGLSAREIIRIAHLLKAKKLDSIGSELSDYGTEESFSYCSCANGKDFYDITFRLNNNLSISVERLKEMILNKSGINNKDNVSITLLM